MKLPFRIIETSQSSGFPEYVENRPDSVEWTRLYQDKDASVEARNRELILIDPNGKNSWQAPVVFDGIPTAVHASGDRLLVMTDSLEYTAWGMLGPAILLRREDGTKTAELRGQRGKCYGNGHFLLGLEGYDVYNTWLYNGEGVLLQEWRSYGHYTVLADGSVLVIECDRNIPTGSRIVRLIPDGSIERGSLLKDGQVSAPVSLENGTLLFVDSGILCAVDGNLKLETVTQLLKVPEREAWRFSANLKLDKFNLDIKILERTTEAPIKYTTHHWAIQLEP